jgi:hypothetical protein
VNRALDIEHLDHRAISNSGFGFRQFQVLLFWSHRACSFVVVANRRYSRSTSAGSRCFERRRCGDLAQAG